MNHDEHIEHINLADEEDHHSMLMPTETAQEYRKFAGVLIAILLISSSLTFVRGWGLERWLGDFMAVFFITFAAFKFVDLESFAQGYRSYDKIAQTIRPWAYAYPFLEAFIGFWYLLSDGSNSLNILTMIVTGSAAVSVFIEIRRKSKFTCACLGKYIRLPLSKVSLVEDVAMFLMALFMLFM